MKVSKTLREYIEEQVNTKANQSESILVLKKSADDATKRFKDEVDNLEKKFSEELQKAMSKYNLNNSRNPYVSIGYCYDRDLPEVIAYLNATRDLAEKKRLAVLNIIAEMELGGTKAELAEKLKNLTF